MLKSMELRLFLLPRQMIRLLIFLLNGKPTLTTGVGWGGEMGFLKARSKTMARRTPKPEAQRSITLTPLRETCEQCGNRLWVDYHSRRKVMTMESLWQLTVVMCHCPTPTCPRYHVRYHPEEEGRWAL